MRLTLMHNAKAGDGDHSGESLIEKLRHTGYEISYQSTRDDDYELALQDPGDLVVVAGGDGTVKKVATHLIGRNIAMALLPLGTANNIARSLGYFGPVSELISMWSSSSHQMFDVGVVRGSWGETRFLESTGFGLFPEMLALDQQEDREISQYQTAEERLAAAWVKLEEVFANAGAKELLVMLDGQDLSGRYLLLEAMNTSFIGPSVCLAPQADPGDGHFELVLLDENDREKFSTLLANPLPGEALPPLLKVHRGQRLQIHCDESMIHIDSELLPEDREQISGKSSAGHWAPGVIDISLENHALKFLVSEAA